MLRDESVTVENHQGVNGDEHATRCDRVHQRLRRIVKARGALDMQEAAALREADTLRLWRHYGYASLIEYMELEMGYSPRAALERLRVANAIVELPQIGEALTQGELSFSAARELTRVATPETERAWLDASADQNLREIEAGVSGRKKGDRPDDPIDPALQTTTVRVEMTAEVYALWRQARQILEQEMGERLDDNGYVAAVCRQVIDGPQPAARTRAPYQIAVTICTQCKRGWQDGAGITAMMSPAAVERAECDAEHIGSLDDDATQRAKQTIPPAARRKVLRRDHGRCRVPGCRSSRNIDVHHIIPRAKGGTNELGNLAVLCESHHLALHAGSLVISGEAPDLVFTRKPQSRFTIEARAVETGLALRSLGFKKHEVSEAIARTRTHVGTTDVTLEQWVKIALGYCPKPR